MQVLSEGPENAFAASQSTLPSFWVAKRYPELVRNTDMVDRSVWKIYM